MKKSAFIVFLVLFWTALSAADTLVNVSNEPKGTNCENGGVRIDIGEDSDPANGILDENEVENSYYVCNGIDGSATAVSITEEAPGGACGEAGGIKITAGAVSRYVCNGADGSDALSRTSEEAAGENCENGGIKIEVGLDNNPKNGILDDEEVNDAQTKYACNGADGDAGKNALVKVTDEPKGNNCKNGTGIKIEVGIDTDGNKVLDNNEVTNTQYVCNGKNAAQGAQGDKGDPGEPGINGTDGKDGAQGEKGDTGPKGDQGDQGAQGETGENGKNGLSSIVSVVDEPKGENCVSGGKRINVGLDANGNGTLDEEEIDPESVYYVCNGRDAEEAGLTSSSTGCSVNAVDDTYDMIFAFFAMISLICAFAATKFARR